MANVQNGSVSSSSVKRSGNQYGHYNTYTYTNTNASVITKSFTNTSNTYTKNGNQIVREVQYIEHIKVYSEKVTVKKRNNGNNSEYQSINYF